ncbi:ribosome assembly RNA-binding protein YhbY [Candidatus Woesearchaeota archaeon CG10_big_fil_rev_8_21_14_0_10_44_13]|nr:MAG: ribosome assembly RNA-binding protein YhbY [Candidatus Woesearchaeota archaeon CG10_big_fil_rev_8_21_14_0_10_44_13]
MKNGNNDEDGLSNEKIKQLKAASYDLGPVVWIGKAGITETVIQEAKKQLKNKGLIKVKFLKQSMEQKSKKELAKEIAGMTGSHLVHQVGFIAVLYKERTKEDE